jgi:GNAT superfamily N-acetyltransferase
MWPHPDADPELRPVAPGDFEALLALRIRAMRPSLEALGRFTPERARERFAGGFAPQHMHHVLRGGERVGCVTLKPEVGALRLDHLYVEPTHQRQGLGQWVLDWACALADQRQEPLLLTALQGSDAMRLYRRNGFVPISSEGVDVHHRREPAAPPSAVVRSLWSRFQARDWAGARRLLHDQAVLTWWATAERLHGGDAIIHVNAVYPEGWTIHPLGFNLLQDGCVASWVRVDHGLQSFLASTVFRVRHGLIVQADETWATCEAAPAWRDPSVLPGLERLHL